MSEKNKRCPCGSGKKFKNCCGETSARHSARPDIQGRLKNARDLYDAGLLSEAQVLYEGILGSNPRNKVALFELSLIAIAQRDYARAESLLNEAIKQDQGNHVYYGNLGYVLQAAGRPVEAAEVLGKAIALRPDSADAYLNRANAFTIQGQIEKAVEDYRKAISLDPASRIAKSNLAYTLNFSPSIPEDVVRDAHLESANALRLVSNPVRITSVPDRNKVLRLGYLSSDFRRHSVSYFIEPVLECHDRDGFQVFGYYNHEILDETTERLKGACDHWRAISKLNDHGVVRQIQDDGIDILIDLNGYTAYNRLGVLARKPAPIQCEWLGYPNTTGMTEVDYWICDQVTNPPGMTDACYTEQLLRLPGCFLCFRPPQESPRPTEGPLGRNGYITFGSFNNFAKVSERVLELWAQILKAVPDSRILIKSACLGHAEQRRVVNRFFAARDVHPERVVLHGYAESRADHMELYSCVDIALDTFPYNGTTTTCEALWMGVPVITLAGQVHRSRVGKSLLETVGLGCLVASTPADYIRIALDLSRDGECLSRYRAQLRHGLQHSPLTDGVRFTRALESEYRRIWQRWCDDHA